MPVWNRENTVEVGEVPSHLVILTRFGGAQELKAGQDQGRGDRAYLNRVLTGPRSSCKPMTLGPSSPGIKLKSVGSRAEAKPGEFHGVSRSLSPRIRVRFTGTMPLLALCMVEDDHAQREKGHPLL